jgi:hypothetical protein
MHAAISDAVRSDAVRSLFLHVRTLYVFRYSERTESGLDGGSELATKTKTTQLLTLVAKPSMRVSKLLAQTGLCSRRVAEGWISSGEVTINGIVAHLGQQSLDAKDVIRLKGKRVVLRRAPKRPRM